MKFNFFPMVLDLHGYDVNSAIAAILNALYEFKQDEYNNYFDIIVGIGSGIIRQITEDLLDKEGYYWKNIGNNLAKIRVFKKI